ncbi:hypothetical protein CYMTET_37056 [Cymbomonas tetramitiformis]|uniref:Helicase ATP-binding domain-containing protein n=1 Tax=Cymbomonas tetramitiformis TaxID=36881 RepID=A0AAE0CEU8_9CHLO|nr:hypothetical protein CYMTET_37056 [Cymbomonas tetramitiformis]
MTIGLSQLYLAPSVMEMGTEYDSKEESVVRSFKKCAYGYSYESDASVVSDDDEECYAICDGEKTKQCCRLYPEVSLFHRMEHIRQAQESTFSFKELEFHTNPAFPSKGEIPNINRMRNEVTSRLQELGRDWTFFDKVLSGETPSAACDQVISFNEHPERQSIRFFDSKQPIFPWQVISVEHIKGVLKQETKEMHTVLINHAPGSGKTFTMSMILRELFGHDKESSAFFLMLIGPDNLGTAYARMQNIYEDASLFEDDGSLKTNPVHTTQPILSHYPITHESYIPIHGGPYFAQMAAYINTMFRTSAFATRSNGLLVIIDEIHLILGNPVKFDELKRGLQEFMNHRSRQGARLRLVLMSATPVNSTVEHDRLRTLIHITNQTVSFVRNAINQYVFGTCDPLTVSRFSDLPLSLSTRSTTIPGVEFSEGEINKSLFLRELAGYIVDMHEKASLTPSKGSARQVVFFGKTDQIFGFHNAGGFEFIKRGITEAVITYSGFSYNLIDVGSLASVHPDIPSPATPTQFSLKVAFVRGGDENKQIYTDLFGTIESSRYSVCPPGDEGCPSYIDVLFTDSSITGADFLGVTDVHLVNVLDTHEIYQNVGRAQRMCSHAWKQDVSEENAIKIHVHGTTRTDLRHREPLEVTKYLKAHAIDYCYANDGNFFKNASLVSSYAKRPDSSAQSSDVAAEAGFVEKDKSFIEFKTRLLKYFPNLYTPSLTLTSVDAINHFFKRNLKPSPNTIAFMKRYADSHADERVSIVRESFETPLVVSADRAKQELPLAFRDAPVALFEHMETILEKAKRLKIFEDASPSEKPYITLCTELAGIYELLSDNVRRVLDVKEIKTHSVVYNLIASFTQNTCELEVTLSKALNCLMRQPKDEDLVRHVIQLQKTMGLPVVTSMVAMPPKGVNRGQITKKPTPTRTRQANLAKMREGRQRTPPGSPNTSAEAGPARGVQAAPLRSVVAPNRMEVDPPLQNNRPPSGSDPVAPIPKDYVYDNTIRYYIIQIGKKFRSILKDTLEALQRVEVSATIPAARQFDSHALTVFCQKNSSLYHVMIDAVIILPKNSKDVNFIINYFGRDYQVLQAIANQNRLADFQIYTTHNQKERKYRPDKYLWSFLHYVFTKVSFLKSKDKSELKNHTEGLYSVSDFGCFGLPNYKLEERKLDEDIHEIAISYIRDTFLEPFLLLNAGTNPRNATQLKQAYKELLRDFTFVQLNQNQLAKYQKLTNNENVHYNMAFFSEPYESEIEDLHADFVKVQAGLDVSYVHHYAVRIVRSEDPSLPEEYRFIIDGVASSKYFENTDDKMLARISARDPKDRLVTYIVSDRTAVKLLNLPLATNIAQFTETNRQILLKRNSLNLPTNVSCR